MILLLAVVTGLLAGLVRAWYGGRHLRSPKLRLAWLVPLAFLPQLLAFYLPVPRHSVADSLAAAALVTSQAVLLVFAWLNRDQPGFPALGLGLALNLLVISLNGGLMPISPETVAQLLPPGTWQVGDRLGRNVVLPTAAMRLGWLSDHLLMPAWFPNRKALSPGDVFIAGGAFWLLWAMGGPDRAQMVAAEREGA
jgi:hypothetical protein